MESINDRHHGPYRNSGVEVVSPTYPIVDVTSVRSFILGHRFVGVVNILTIVMWETKPGFNKRETR